MISTYRYLFLAVALAAGGCGAEDESDDADAGSAAAPAAPAADEGESVSVAITAAMGGEVASPSGTGKLAIPAGALGGDVTITLAVAAASAGSVSSVYEFGPDGTTFAMPATLEIKFDGEVAEDKKAVLAVLTDGKWTEIPGSSLSDGVVSGPVAHFSSFSIIIVDGMVVLQSGCSDVAEAFEACGGDPSGTWTMKDVCVANQSLGADPFNGMCDGASLMAEIDLVGTVTFADGKINPQTTVEQTATLHIPNTCFNGMGCNEFAKEDEGWTCSDSADACDCTKSETKPNDDEDISDYVVEGNEIVSTDEDGSMQRLPFCVSGGTLTVKIKNKDEDGPDIYYTAEK